LIGFLFWAFSLPRRKRRKLNPLAAENKAKETNDMAIEASCLLFIVFL
jgi:hypothetical protein